MGDERMLPENTRFLRDFTLILDTHFPVYTIAFYILPLFLPIIL